MRIFQVLHASTNQAIPDNQTWYRNLYEPLVELGHDVYLFSSMDGKQAMAKDNVHLRAAFSQRMLEVFRKEHQRSHFDLVFSYLMDGMVDTGVLDDIRRVGVPTCNFSCNNAHQFHLVNEISPHFDFNLHAEKDARHKFLEIGANPFWWPMASNPKYFRPIDIPRTIDVSFVGANYGLRGRYIGHLLDHDIQAQVYGPRWWPSLTPMWRLAAKRVKLLAQAMLARTLEQKAYHSGILAEHDFHQKLFAIYSAHFHQPVSDAELIALYSKSQISLGFLEVYNQHNPSKSVTQHLHLREFEAPMSGALYLTGYSAELAEFFEPDKEMLVYRNRHELLEKVQYYLANPVAAEEIRRAGHRRALQEHTYQHRFNTLFDHLGLSK
jgi:spore maturation protein CgeB